MRDLTMVALLGVAGCGDESSGAGPVGPAGPIGATGPAGPSGATGPAGPAGPPGAAGPVGPAGPAGPDGATGVSGAPGTMGPAGPPGQPGAPGAPGSPGPPGAPGTTGPQGPAGAVGAAGPRGPAGPAGNGAESEDEVGFAGFTAATFTGNLGGRPAAHAACAAEFAGGHLCHASEYVLSTSTTAVPASGAWLDASVTAEGVVTVQGSSRFGRNSGRSCQSFTTDQAGNEATYLAPSGAIVQSNVDLCTIARPLACCDGAPKPVLAGFTAQAFTGNLGGRPAAHARCDAAFAGSHVCHAVEYLRTVSSTPVPAPGAWIDASIDERGVLVLHGPASSGRNTGRSCIAFTTAGAGNEGTYVRPNGAPFSTNLDTCATARPIACCY